MIHPFDVKALRERIVWTQEQLAQYLGVDRSSISRMENGQALSGPVQRLLVILAAAADAGTADALLTSETDGSQPVESPATDPDPPSLDCTSGAAMTGPASSSSRSPSEEAA